MITFILIKKVINNHIIMAVSSIRTPPNRFINDTRVFKFEKEKKMANPSRDQLYLERSEFMKHIGWEFERK